LEIVYVLLTTEMGSGNEVLEALDKILDIKEVHKIHGVYDFIIRVETETQEELKSLIGTIRSIDKIRTTLSLICVA